jgi:hypothetical protein
VGVIVRRVDICGDTRNRAVVIGQQLDSLPPRLSSMPKSVASRTLG